MAYIDISNASAVFDIYNAKTRSLKNTSIEFLTGGQIAINNDKNITVSALNNIDLRIQEGERVGLVGHNGSGKTTLLRMICGVYAPTTGKVRVEGGISSLIDINLGTDQEATGRQNILLRAAMLGIPKRLVSENIEKIIAFSELGDFIDLPIRTYSSGMQLRLAFAVSTYFASEIVVMDEWISVGDSHFAQKAEERLKQYVDEAKILVIASHSAEFLKKICTRIIWLEHGSIRFDGNPEKALIEYSK